MAHMGTSIRVVIAGWGLTFLFAVLFLTNGQDELLAAVLYWLVAVIMATWVWRRRSRPALVVSLVLGLLHAIEQVAYIASDVNGNNAGAVTLVADIIGLIGGVLLVAGATAALSRRNRPRPDNAADQVRPAAGARGTGSR